MKVFIPVVAPSGLRVSHDPQVSVHEIPGEGEQLSPPDPDDPFVVCFTDLDHFHSGWQRASETARLAALKDRRFGIVIERTEALPQETLDIVRRIGREAGIEEVPLGVQRLS